VDKITGTLKNMLQWNVKTDVSDGNIMNIMNIIHLRLHWEAVILLGL